MIPTVPKARITATIEIVAMSQAPDTVSQFVNSFDIGQPFFEKDGLAIDSGVVVGPAAFPKMARKETLRFINAKTEVHRKLRE
jgi:hypothetical protein